ENQRNDDDGKDWTCESHGSTRHDKKTPTVTRTTTARAESATMRKRVAAREMPHDWQRFSENG
ncbi:MAG: hypothetical protein WCS72_16855, partial [Deltaproteobacteria bacterium]